MPCDEIHCVVIHEATDSPKLLAKMLFLNILLIPLVLYFSKEGINLTIVVSFATGLCTLLGRVPAGERKREGAAALT